MKHKTQSTFLKNHQAADVAGEVGYIVKVYFLVWRKQEYAYANPQSAS
jgi:hypothetical protein